jgi:hypothetical protein
MVLLNGIPPILGISLLHVTALNIFAIVFEYWYIKRKHKISRLLLRSIVSNVLSLAAGLFVLYFIPDLMEGNIMRSDAEMNNHDRLSMVLGLTGLFLANLAVELPVYLLGKRTGKASLTKTVFAANLISNLPVFFFYGLMML